MATIPKSWADVTIAQYQSCTEILSKKLSDIEQRIELALLFAGEESLSWTVAKLKEETEALSFLTIKPSGKMVYGFELQGRSFTINPIIQSITAGQFIDLSNILKEPSKTIDNLHNIMAVISTSGKYEGYVENGKLFRDHLTMDKVFPVSAFFLKVGESYLKIIQCYLTAEVKKALKEEKKLRKLEERHSNSIGAGS